MLKRLWALPTLPTLTAGCLYLCVCVCVCLCVCACACVRVYTHYIHVHMSSLPTWLASLWRRLGLLRSCFNHSDSSRSAFYFGGGGRGEGSSSQRRQAHLLPQRLG